MKMNNKRNNGITLIALIITIIVLLILAGITVAQLSGNGLFENAKLAKEKYKNSKQDEDNGIYKYNNKIEEYLNNGRDYEAEISELTQEINSLKTTVNYNLSQILEISSDVQSVTGYIKRNANVVDINLMVTYGSAVTANSFSTFATLKDSSLKPTNNDVWGNSQAGTSVGNFNVTTSGILKLRNAISTTVYLVNATYVVE